MNKPIPTGDPHAHHEEYVDRRAKLLGRSQLRNRIFRLIYGRGTRPKTVDEIMAALELGKSDRQLVLNEVNYLAKNRLISWEKVARKKQGGSERAYGKIEDIMAVKDEILKYAGKKALREKIPTKRRPQAAFDPQAKTRRPAAARKLREKVRILFLTATPSTEEHLRTDAEARIVQEELRGSIYRDNIELHIRPAADAKSILNGINDLRPHIVHFSGHGGLGAIVVDDGEIENSTGQELDFQTLADLIGATSSPPSLLVLNACDTVDGAAVLLDSVKIVVAMSDSISDLGAAIFSAQFYAALASAQPVSVAVKQGKARMKSAMLSDAQLPEIVHRPDVNPKTFVLVKKK